MSLHGLSSRAAPAALGLGLAVGACSSVVPNDAPGGSASATFPAEPYVAAMSDAHRLRVEVRTSPQPPARGLDRVELRVFDASNEAPVDGLRVDVTPWMPSMGHGTSVVPTVTPEGDGRYLVTNVSLYMPGVWELRTSLSGAVTDHAAPALQVP